MHSVAENRSFNLLVYVWLFIVIGSNLQTIIYPHLDWVFAFFVGALALPTVWTRRHELPWSIFIGPAMVVGSILLTAAVSEAPFYNIAQAGKLAAMLIWGLAFFALDKGMVKRAIQVFVVVMVINAILLILGSTWGTEITTDRRSITVLNVPGTLGAVGLSILVYGLYLLTSKPKRLYGALVAIGSLALVYFENSRTVTPLAILAVLFCIVVVLWERLRGLKRSTLVAGGCLALVAIAAAVAWIPLPSRFEALVELILEKGFIAGLASSDPARAMMVEAAIEAVSSFPILGSGMGTLGVISDHGWIEVHMAYLQLWSDAGFIAFLGFVWIVVEWVRWAPRALRTARNRIGSEQSALIYNSIFTMIAFALMNLLHTFSTEWAQWLPYLVSYSILYNAANKEPEVQPQSTSPSS